MRFAPSCLILIAFKLIFASEIENGLILDEEIENHQFEGFTSIIDQNIGNVNGESKSLIEYEYPSQFHDEYDGTSYVKFSMENSLPDLRRKPFASAKNSRNFRKIESPIESYHLVPFLPVDKPIPSNLRADSSENEEDYNAESVDVNVKDFLSMIPYRFTVTETSGIYDIFEDEAFMTSADVMMKRSVLYRLLSEVYTFFDTFDFDGFLHFLSNYKSVVFQHFDLRYHLIENLVKRSLKTKNEGTLECLVRLIQMIDSASDVRTAGKEKIDNLKKFKRRIDELTIKNNQVSAQIKLVLTDYFTNEKRRLDPLQEPLSSGDYDTVKAILESSQYSIFLSASDFDRILELPCSSARFHFISWAILRRHFNPYERFDNQLTTPLMAAAMCSRWSNDIVKAILLKAPETQNLKNSHELTALDLAKRNKDLKKVFREPLIEMLELENLGKEALNDVLNKYLS